MANQLKISVAHMTVGDVIRAEDGFKSNRETIEFLARFVVDADGNPIERGAALEMIMALPIGELASVTQQLTEQVSETRAAAVPLADGDS
jgi:hypothetical protein